MGELPAWLPLLFLIMVEARVEKAVKPQVGPGSWQGSGQEGGPDQVFHTLMLYFFL